MAAKTLSVRDAGAGRLASIDVMLLCPYQSRTHYHLLAHPPPQTARDAAATELKVG